MFFCLHTHPYIVLVIVFAIVIVIFYGIRVSVKKMIINHIERAGCSEIKFQENLWNFSSILFSIEYIDRGGNRRKNRCVFLTGPFIKDGIFWEEPLNL